MLELSIIIPAYNESRRIKDTLDGIVSYFANKNVDFEVIIVSDGSTDDTCNVAGTYSKAIPRLTILDLHPNRGKGHAVKQGMQKANGKYRLFMDADNATSISELDKLLPYLIGAGGSYDVVIGSIGLDSQTILKGESMARVVLGKMGNLLIRTLVVPDIHDTQRGFKLFTSESAQVLFREQTIDRWGFDIELLSLANQIGYTVKEVPVKWTHKEESKVTPLSYLQVLLNAVTLAIKIRTSKQRARLARSKS